jgi:xylose isomerase
VPTVGADEGWRGLLDADLLDPDALAVRGGGFELLDQLALEHLYGVR